MSQKLHKPKYPHLQTRYLGWVSANTHTALPHGPTLTAVVCRDRCSAVLLMLVPLDASERDRSVLLPSPEMAAALTRAVGKP